MRPKLPTLLIVLGALLVAVVARATPPNTISGSVAICSAYNPFFCAEPTSDGSLQTTSSPSAVAASGIAPSTTPTAASSRVLKASPGNLYGVELTAGASAGYLLVYDAVSAPADGVVTPKYCKNVPANTAVELGWVVPAAFVTGITVAFSTTGCFTQTLSATAFISGMVK